MIKGWDDAPPVKLADGEPKPVVLVYPFYCNPHFLKRQVQTWGDYPSSLRPYLSAIIVDDGSPSDKSAESVLAYAFKPFQMTLFRITVDIRWNWLAARNIAMHHAADGWCMATDMDHIIPPDTIRNLIYQQHDPQIIYRFRRREWTGEVIHEHPNSWFMTRQMFWKFGGYDEALSGHYGTDGEARRRWVQTAPVRTLPDFLQRHEHMSDSSTTNYKRKQPEDMVAQTIIKNRGPDWKPKVLSFPFHEVQL